MSDDPIRLAELPGAPPELARLVRHLDGPPPLPPALRVRIRGRLRPTSLPVPPTRWIAPAVVGAAAVIAGLVLWTFRPSETPAPVLSPAPELATGPAADGPEGPEPPVAPRPRVEGELPQPAPVVAEDARLDLGPTASESPRPAGGPPANAELRIAVPGGWADVYVDGVHRGSTPITVHVPAGQRRLMLRFRDGREHTQLVQVPADGALVRIDPPPAAPVTAAVVEPPPPAPRAPLPSGPGTRTAAEVRQVLSGLRPELQRCFERFLRGGGTTSGPVRANLRVDIAASGLVTRVTASGTAPAAVQRCAEAAARRSRFGAAAAPMAVNYPVVFSNPNGPASAPERGRLMVNSSPWARVYVDGRSVGNTPVMNLPLSAGRHELVLETPDGRRTRRSISIRAGQTERVLHRFASPDLEDPFQ